jgi:hypothetical protein
MKELANIDLMPIIQAEFFNSTHRVPGRYRQSMLNEVDSNFLVESYELMDQDELFSYRYVSQDNMIDGRFWFEETS